MLCYIELLLNEIKKEAEEGHIRLTDFGLSKVLMKSSYKLSVRII